MESDYCVLSVILNEIAICQLLCTLPTHFSPKDSCSIDRPIDQEGTKERYDTNK